MRSFVLSALVSVLPALAAQTPVTMSPRAAAAGLGNTGSDDPLSAGGLPNNDWAVAPFPFDRPFTWSGGPLEWRAIVYWNGNNGQPFSYPLDGFSGQGPSVPNGLGCQSALGTAPATHTALVNWPGSFAVFVGRPGGPLASLPTALTLGVSGSSWQGLSLPFDLGVIGAPACFINNDILLTKGNMTSSRGTISVTDTLTIPDDPTLSGGTFFSQHLFLQPGANALGLFTSNGQRSTIGAPIGVSSVYRDSRTGTNGSLRLQSGLSIGLN